MYNVGDATRPKSGFLDLPSEIRYRIYHYAGITDKTVDLNWWRTDVYATSQYPDENEALWVLCWHDIGHGIVRRKDSRTFDEYWEDDEDWKRGTSYAYARCAREDCSSDDCGFTLMLTCRALFTELNERVYGKNRFVIDRGGPRGFEPFFRLGTSSIHSLTHLTIRLDGEPPHNIDMSQNWTRTSALLPMKHYSRYGKEAYKQWNNLLLRLKECSIVPGQLNLFLLAKVPNVEEAEFVLRPLESLPTLNSSGIWLNSKPIPELIARIKKTAETLIAFKPEDENQELEEVVTFRYLDLPQELRFRVLEFSDLCSPIDLEWKPPTSSCAPILEHACSCYNDLGHFDEALHYDGCSRPLIERPRVAENGLEKEYDELTHCCCCKSVSKDWQECKAKTKPYMCIFGCSRHSSYTTFSREAWKPFCHALFLVSHQVRRDAIPIFFQQRHFVITPLYVMPLRHLKRHPDDFYFLARTRMLRMELSLFLSSMAKLAIRYIRYVEWIIPALDKYRSFSKSACLDYLDTIDMMVHAMTLPSLTLVINMRALPTHHLDYDNGYGYTWPCRRPDDRDIYDKLLRPLCRLGDHGLKDCWIYLKMISTDYPRYHLDYDELIWEMRIMGDQNYNAFVRGKPKRERVERTVTAEPGYSWMHSADAGYVNGEDYAV